MWVVEWQSKAVAHCWYTYTAYEFRTEEEANTFMVMQIFDEPWYNYRVREIKEES